MVWKRLEALLRSLAASCGDEVQFVEHHRQRLVPLELQTEAVKDYGDLEAGDCLAAWPRELILYMSCSIFEHF